MFVFPIINTSIILLYIGVTFLQSILLISRWIYLKRNFYYLLSLGISELLFQFSQQIFLYYVQIYYFILFNDNEIIEHIFNYQFVIYLFQMYFLSFSFHLFDQYLTNSQNLSTKRKNMYISDSFKIFLIVSIIFSYIFFKTEWIFLIISVYMFVLVSGISFSKFLRRIILLNQINFLIVSIIFFHFYFVLPHYPQFKSLLQFLLYYQNRIQLVLFITLILQLIFHISIIKTLDPENIKKFKKKMNQLNGV